VHGHEAGLRVSASVRRLLVGHLVATAFGAWALYVLADVQQNGDLGRAVLVAANTVLGLGPFGLLALSVFLVPASVATGVLAARFGHGSRMTRVALGAVAWSAWTLFVAANLALGSGIVINVADAAGSLLVSAATGALYAVLALDDAPGAPRRPALLTAVAVTAFVVLGSLMMAGHWGGAA
jgi:hypothetical protein